MIVVLQRVSEASVEVEGRVVGQVGRGVCLLVGAEKGDRERDVQYLADKVAGLRIFPDKDGKMNLGLDEVGGEVLVVSQFTLAASVRKGRRPSFDGAEDPARAEGLLQEFVERLRNQGLRVETGVFQASMTVRIVNDGPVTFVLHSQQDRDPEG